MTIRSSNDPIRKAPKVTELVLNRETLQELTEREAAAVEGGNILDRSRRLACGTIGCRPSRTCPTLKYDCRLA